MTHPEPYSLFVRRLQEGGLSEEQVQVVLLAIGNICNRCWEDWSPCCCERDD